MSGNARRSRATIASLSVSFARRRPKEPAVEQPELARPSRLALQLAMAYKIDRMIRRGEIRNMAEAARLAGVTRARMTQIANMTLLAPAIQESFVVAISNESVPTERGLRPISAVPTWGPQMELWARLRNGNLGEVKSRSGAKKSLPTRAGSDG